MVSPQVRSDRVRKISPPLVFDARTVQPVASRYTDYAVSAVLLSADILYRILSVSNEKWRKCE